MQSEREIEPCQGWISIGLQLSDLAAAAAAGGGGVQPGLSSVSLGQILLLWRPRLRQSSSGALSVPYRNKEKERRRKKKEKKEKKKKKKKRRKKTRLHQWK